MHARKPKRPSPTLLPLNVPRLSRRSLVLAVATLAGAGALCYSNTFRVPFIFDDMWHITENPEIQNFARFWDVVPGRPVLGLSLALNYQFAKLNVCSYHMVNLGLHILTALVLFALVRRTLFTPRLRERFAAAATPLAWSVALLWLVHPMHTQAVTYIVQRGEVLMSLFYLLTLYCALRAYDAVAQASSLPEGQARSQTACATPRPGVWIAGAIVFCLAGLGSKQVMVTAPVMVLLYYWVFLPEALKQASRRAKAWSVGAGLIWLGLSVWLALLSAHPTAGFGMERVTPWAYARTQFSVLVHYLRLAFWPDVLCLDYGWPTAQTAGEIVPCAAVIAALAAGTLWALKRAPVWGFLGAWFFIILAPTSSIMPIADMAFEQRMYLPLAGLAAGVVLGGYALFQVIPCGASAGIKAARTVLLAVLAAALGLLTFERNWDYRTELAIWGDTIRKRPADFRAHNILGLALARQNRLTEAVAQFEEAVHLQPDCVDPYNNLGNAWSLLKNPEKALQYYTEGVRRKPDWAEAHANLANLLTDLGRSEEALAEMRVVACLWPQSAPAHHQLGVALAKAGLVSEAQAEFRRALELDSGLTPAQTALARLREQQR